MNCPICLEPIETMITLACNHSYCLPCIIRWNTTSDTCPLCRREHHLPVMTCSSKTQRNKVRRLKNRIERLEIFIDYISEMIDIYELQELHPSSIYPVSPDTV